MDSYTILQTFVFGLLGLSLYIKLWKHSITAMIMVSSSALSLLFFPYNISLAIYIYMFSVLLVVLRATIKPADEAIIPRGRNI